MAVEAYSTGDKRSLKERADRRYSALLTERSTWDAHWREISDYLLPRSGRFLTTERNKGTKRHNLIYDSSATKALRVLGAGMQSGATSPARPWFRLGTNDSDLMEYAPVKVWLSQCTSIMLSIFSKSNTYRTLHQLYEELGAFGTGATVMLDDFDTGIHHYPMTIGEYCLSLDYKGRVNTLYHEYERKVWEVVEEFGLENCSLTVRNHYDNGNYDIPVLLCHFIEPRPPGERKAGSPLAKHMAFRSCTYERGQPGDKLLRDSGMRFFRGLAPRWQLTPGDTYGSSPGMEALGDIKQLQHQQLRKAEGIDYQTKPPLQVPLSAKNQDVNRLPGGVSFIDMAGVGSGVKSLFESRVDLSHLLADIQDVRQRVREVFYTDMFLMISASQYDNRRTATEVAELHEEKLLMLGPVLERLHNELLDPKTSMVFSRALETGTLPPPPEELQGQEINVEYVSVLAQAQRAVSTGGVDRFVMNLGQLATMKPEVMDKLDADKWADTYSDMLGVDPELIVAGDKVALIRQQRAEQQRAMQQAAMIQQGADTAAKLGNAPTDGKNALTDVMQMFSGYAT